MRLLIDGNVVLDVLMMREPFFPDSSAVWKMCETNIANGSISVLTFMNLAYIMRKDIDPDKVKDIYNKMSQIFSFENLNNADLYNALSLGWHDYEDAVQYITAQRIRADYIITRNVKDFEKSSITALTPVEFLKRIRNDNQ